MGEKFVTFEEIIAQIVVKSENNSFSQVERNKKNEYDEIPGYTLKNGKILRSSNYIWTKDDWNNYNYWLKIFTDKKKLDMRKLLIMAASDQAKRRTPPPRVVF